MLTAAFSFLVTLLPLTPHLWSIMHQFDGIDEHLLSSTRYWQVFLQSLPVFVGPNVLDLCISSASWSSELVHCIRLGWSSVPPGCPIFIRQSRQDEQTMRITAR